MRRYGLKYHVVGGFSFYERAEIKDMISYLKVIHNPDDSISLLRVINVPVRGIGKTSIETLERVALETGLSLWGALRETIQRKLLPARALAALEGFTGLIEDARSMRAGSYEERLEQTALAEPAREEDDQETEAPPVEDATDFTPDNFAFELGERFESTAGVPPDGGAFRSPGGPATSAELLKFLIDRTGYLKLLEEEDTPEAYSR